MTDMCLNGSPVDLQLVEALVGMGYPRRLAISALCQSNNRVALAVRYIVDQPDAVSYHDYCYIFQDIQDDCGLKVSGSDYHNGCLQVLHP